MIESSTGFQPTRLLHFSLRWWATGIGLIGLHVALALISPSFAYERQVLSKPIVVLVALQLFAGVLFLLAVWRIREAGNCKGLLICVIVVGAVMRVSMLTSTPMLEDDFYRYLWDGALAARGLNPWTVAPDQVAGDDKGEVSVNANLHQLATESGDILSRANHPHLRSIYPPVAQAAFALAHWMSPWDISAWRLVLLACDAMTLSLLIILLQALKRPLSWLAVYWWNPVLVKEIFNSNHMDVIVLPFVLISVLLYLRGQHTWAAASLGLAVGAKLWPVLLLPIVLRPILFEPKKLIPAVSVFCLLSCVLFFPVYSAGLNDSSGFMAYGRSWEMNDALFMPIQWTIQAILKGMNFFADHSQEVSRAVVLVLLAIWISWLARRAAKSPSDFCEKCLWIIAGAFLLSPTQFPWYYVWLLPFLAIRPHRPLLLLTALLPLYYLRFYLDARDSVKAFDFGIVWLEYVPVWVLLFREWYIGRYQGDCHSNSLPKVAACYEK